MKKLYLIVLLALSFFANAQTLHYSFNPYTQYNMNLTGQLYLNGEAVDAENLEIGVFVGDECRGAKLPVLRGTRWIYYLTIYSNAISGEVLDFKVYDHETQTELVLSHNIELTFTANDIIGNTPNPYHLNFSSECTITTAVNPEIGGTVTGAGTYLNGESCTLTATAATGYTFANWTVGDEVITENPYTFTVTGDADYTANFTLNNYNVTVTAAPTEGGTVTGGGNYDHGASATLVATAATGYTFNNWTLNNEVVSTDPTYIVEVTGAANYVANFTLNSYVIAATANPTAGGTVTGAGTYNHFEECTLTATAATGYTFTNWTKNGEVVSTNAAYQFTVSEAGSYIANFTLNTYAIGATANPTAGGTVTGAGTYSHGATAVLIATAATGYTFNNWTLAGEEVSTNPTLTFTVTGAADYVANFTLNSYAIGVTANPTAGGTVTGAGTYNHFEECTLTATANTGYTFTNWTLNGTAVATTPTLTFTVTGAANYVANFTLNTYAITAVANPTAGGTVTGAGTYNHGAAVTLTATAATGYTFVNWTKDGEQVSTDAIYMFTATAAGAYVANFTLNSYVITGTADPEEGGVITGSGGYNHGQSVTLTATANTGYTFTKWTKAGVDYATTNAITFTATETVEYVAHFTLNSYAIGVTANPTAGGTVTGAGTYFHGATATLVATATVGYTFTNWTKDGEAVSVNPEYSFTVTGAANYVANFTLNTYELTVTANPTAGGTVTGAGTYNHGATATLVATAATGYTFNNWTLNGTVVSTTSTYSFAVTEAGAYVANFTLNSYEISASANPTAGGTVAGAGTYNHGVSCTLTATANTGYTFANWTKNGAVVSTNASYTFTVTEAGTYVANFTLNTYNITVTAAPSVGGTVTGGGTYNYGTSVTLVATPATGYTFNNWTLNGEVVSTNPSYNFTVTANGSYVANFTLNSFVIEAVANPTEGGTVTGAGTYNYGDICTLTATPATGYEFINWTCGNEVVATTPTYTMTVTASGTYIANFQLVQVDIQARPNPLQCGTVTGSGTYTYGDQVTLTATPNTGYRFVNWTTNGGVITSEPTLTFTAVESGLYLANFEHITHTITATANPTSAGTVTGGGTFNYGTTCTLTATANEGYSFVSWTKNGQVVSTTAIYNFYVTSDGAYVANFEQGTYAITATANPEDGGTIAGTGSYNYGANCTLQAVAAEGYSFVNWTLNGEVVATSANYTFQVTGPAAYVANFEVASYQITVNANPTGYGTVAGGGTYEYGTTVTVLATPSAGHLFISWTENGVVVSDEEAYTFVVTGARTLIANFDEDGVIDNNVNVLTVYPNPTEGQLYVKNSAVITRCEIYSVSGRMVYSERENSESIVIDVDNLETGAYIIRIFTEESVVVSRFIKK